MASGVLDRWSCGGGPGERAGDVAARSLKIRLETVRDAFARAATAAEDDEEAVHALRVAARRAAAAIRLYAGWLPTRQATRWKARLKRVRRVAGTARDADVLIRRLTEPGTVSQANPVWEPLLRQRRKARKPIRRLFHVTEDDAWFGRGVKRLLRHIGRQTEWSDVRFDVWARSQLKHSADRFFHAAPSSDESPCLHRFRIRAKYLRYALELFAGAFPISQAEEAYRSIDAVQRELGEINDRSTGLDWLRDQLRETDDPDTFDQIRGYFLRQKEEWDRSRSAFLQSWTAGRGAVLRDRFDRLLDGEPAQDDDRGASRPPPRSRLVPMELTES